MDFPIRTKFACATLMTGVLMCPTSYALVRWHEGKEQIFVNLGVTAAWDSNVFTANGGEGDLIYTGSLSLDYQRRAGMIGVNGNIGFNVGRFDEFEDENFQNPNYRIELTKDSGRTTGALSASAQRQSRADPDANIRTDSWAYNTTLNLKYPVIERYSVTGGFGYGFRDYDDNTVLVDLSTYSFSSDLFYVFTTERDLIAGYRLRINETSADTTFYDHAFTVGVSGKILAKLNGTVRLGYQIREAIGPNTSGTDSFTASASTTWAINGQATLTGQLSKDLSVTSTNISIDSTSASLNAGYRFGPRMSAYADFGGGINRFLGALGGNREDTFLSWGAGFSYKFSEKLNLSAGYTNYTNWSTASIADFSREGFSVNVNSRL